MRMRKIKLEIKDLNTIIIKIIHMVEKIKTYQ